ncbi:MAG: hypothetical protein K8963_09300, partial [Proteobacteria bacterium]|nr:hypothetical protein [Pseudomonadota bacterium]
MFIGIDITTVLCAAMARLRAAATSLTRSDASPVAPSISARPTTQHSVLDGQASSQTTLGTASLGIDSDYTNSQVGQATQISNIDHQIQSPQNAMHASTYTNGSHAQHATYTNGSHAQHATNTNGSHAQHATNTNACHVRHATNTDACHVRQATGTDASHAKHATNSNSSQPTNTNGSHAKHATNTNAHHVRQATDTYASHAKHSTNSNSNSSQHNGNHTNHTNHTNHATAQPTTAHSSSHHAASAMRAHSIYPAQPGNAHPSQPSGAYSAHFANPPTERVAENLDRRLNYPTRYANAGLVMRHSVVNWHIACLELQVGEAEPSQSLPPMDSHATTLHGGIYPKPDVDPGIQPNQQSRSQFSHQAPGIGYASAASVADLQAPSQDRQPSGHELTQMSSGAPASVSPDQTYTPYRWASNLAQGLESHNPHTHRLTPAHECSEQLQTAIRLQTAVLVAHAAALEAHADALKASVAMSSSPPPVTP